MESSPVFDSAAQYMAAYRGAPGKFAFAGDTPEDVAAWQEAFRPALREALGLDNMDCDLAGHKPHAERTAVVDMGEYVRERWYLWTEPEVPLPFWLLVPKGIEERRPLVLTPHGHNVPGLYVGIARDEDEKKHIEEGDRDVAVQSVREGYVTIAATTRAFGETRNTEDREKDVLNSCRTRFLHGLLVGRTAIGERVWDVSRLIDWAVERDDVDASRIAITGNSGGGTVSLFSAACEERISVAVPSSYFCTFVGSIGTIHHCDCNYVPGILRLGEMADVAGLVAPRPFCAVAGRDDKIFPIEHALAGFEHLKRIYEAAGVSERCELFVGEAGHRYYPAGSWPFIRKWFSADR